MTAFEITFEPNRHRYHIDGLWVPSVTQVLGMIDKSGPLAWWGMRTGVEGVCELRRQLDGEMPWDDPEGIVKLLTSHRLTTNHVKTKAGTRGSSIHRAIQTYCETTQAPNPADYPMEDRGYVQAVARALLELQPEPLEMEVIVGSRTYGYAGTFDMLATIDGVATRIDWKTSKGIYPEMMLQLAAYEEAALECDRGTSERQWIVRLGADGEFEVGESRATFDQFLAVLRAWRALRELDEAQKSQQAKAWT